MDEPTPLFTFRTEDNSVRLACRFLNPREEMPMTKTKTILVVDDDQVLREGLRAVLEKRGYRTLTAEDGHEASQLIDGHRPDLVILDMMMARWGGFAVLEHFQHRADAPRFIMITAHEGDKQKTYARSIGATDYIQKPFTMDRLLHGVEQALRRAPDGQGEVPTLRIECSDCGARIKAPVQLLGQSRPCPRCKATLVVQPAPPEDEGPSLVLDFA
jgi:DNA-binding NtrC family response regulator